MGRRFGSPDRGAGMQPRVERSPPTAGAAQPVDMAPHIQSPGGAKESEHDPEITSRVSP
jgi:hypothetical protein